MEFPKLSRFQSRALASVGATVMLLALYYALTSPLLAYAADVDSLRHEDHNHERILDARLSVDILGDDLGTSDVAYESEFLGVERSIIGRAPTGVDALANNVPALINVPLGTTVHYMFPNDTLWGPYTPQSPGLPSSSRLRARMNEEEAPMLSLQNETMNKHEAGELHPRQTQSTRELYVSVNTCLQPTADESSGPPPQLRLYVSLSDDNPKPGPDTAEQFPQQIEQDLTSGAVVLPVNATGNVYIGVSARNATGYSNVYSASIAASIDAPFHSYTNTTNLFLVDSDNGSALLVTNNLTTAVNGTVYNEWMSLTTPPYVMFANNQNNSRIQGIEHSYCGLESYAQIAAVTADGANTGAVDMGMTSRGLGALPKEQFYVTGLNQSSTYVGILAMNGNSTNFGPGVVGGGGKVFSSMNFTTMSEDNCAVIYDLSFCTDVAYAVPANSNTFGTLPALAAFYDNATQHQYQYFNYSLQQIACETTSTAQYSLVRNCTDCATAYKQWLCSVTIPRCAGFSSDLSWLQDRNVQQPFPNGTTLPASELDALGTSMAVTQSRNPNIDTTVKPGPYKEVLPCQDLCFNIVQSCPSAMGFACPQRGQIGFDTSYGMRPNGSADQNGQITCNYPGAAYHLNAASRAAVKLPWVVLLVALAVWM